MKFLSRFNLAFWVMLTILVLGASAPARAETVTIPYGDWLVAAGNELTPILVALALFMIRKLPPQLVSILMGMKVDQVLAKAISYAINTVDGATHGKPLTVDIANKVVAQAAQYVIDHAPGWLVSWAGDLDLIKQKIIARLDVEGPGVVTGTVPAA